MKFILTSLNPHLCLSDRYFENVHDNIDQLILGLFTREDIKSTNSLISFSIKNIEKFHSYFHFEQSYFHLIQAEYLLEGGNYILAKEQYEHAIFQDHLNIKAHKGLVNLLENSLQKDAAIEYSKKLGLDINLRSKEYGRPYKNFADYLIFATNSSPGFVRSLDLSTNLFYEDFKKSDISNILKDISYKHKQYHKNAAIIYYNYYLILTSAGKFDLAKNALIKSKNLDPEISKFIEIKELSY